MCEPSNKGLCPKHYFEFVNLLLFKLNKYPEKPIIEDDFFTSDILKLMSQQTAFILNYLEERGLLWKIQTMGIWF